MHVCMWHAYDRGIYVSDYVSSSQLNADPG